MGGILGIFGSAHDNVPLNEREILQVGPRGVFDDDLPEERESRVINFNTFLEDGRQPEIENLEFDEQYIDWDSDDAFTQALETIRENTFERIQNSPELQELLAKDSWTREDRVAWERGVSEIVNDEHRQIEGLDRYRNTVDTDIYAETEVRPHRLNDLAEDMEAGTRRIAHQCVSMSIVEGVILQQVDNHFLPENAPDGDLRVSSNYFYAIGRTNFNPEYSGNGSHAFIISSATMNVIEAATTTGNPYNENVNPEMTFEDFIRGEMIINEDTSIYSGYHHTLEDMTRVRFDRGEISLDSIYEQTPLREDLTDQRYANAPPEAQMLIEMKSRIAELEVLRDEGCVLDDGDINDIIEEHRQAFDDAVMELIDDADIQDVMRFNRTVTRHSGTYVQPEVRLEAAYDKVREMNPDWTEDQINQFVFEIEVGAIPGYGVLSSEETYNLRIEKAAEVFRENNPDMDYEEARRASNTGEINNMLHDMRQGEITREELMGNPLAAMALAYRESFDGMSKQYPIPGSAGAYAQLDSRLDAFEREYEEFIGERPTCDALNEEYDSAGIFSIITRQF